MKAGITWRKKIGAMITASLLAGAVPSQTYALPTESTTNPDWINIESIATNGNVMDIVGMGEGINSFIRWKDFSIGADEIVKFTQMQKILNLVDGTNVSNIFGTIQAPGIDVFLLNPNGIIFGAGSQVDVGSLTVSARSLENTDIENFITNGTIPDPTDADLTGGVVFLGKLKADKLVAEGNNITIINSENSPDSETFFSDNTPGFSIKDSANLKVTSYGNVDMPYKANFDADGKVEGLADAGTTTQTLDSKFTATKVSGSGSPLRNDFTIIKTDEDFNKIATNPAGRYMIVADDLTLTDPINGNTAFTFTGAINGLGNKVNLQNSFFAPGSTIKKGTLSNINFYLPAEEISLTGALIADNVTSSSGISNISVGEGNLSFSGIANAGLFGYVNDSSRIENISNAANLTVDSSAKYVGGIAGYTNIGTLKQLRNSGNITANAEESAVTAVGGILGYTETVLNDARGLSNTGNITATSTDVLNIGGLIGKTIKAAVMNNSYNAGDITATSTKNLYVGGILGWSSYGPFYSTTPSLTITNVSNKGNITANLEKAGEIGGIVGYMSGGTFSTTNVYNEGNLNLTGAVEGAGGFIGYDKGNSEFHSSYNKGDIRACW